jgi:hypothetical protein
MVWAVRASPNKPMLPTLQIEHIPSQLVITQI